MADEDDTQGMGTQEPPKPVKGNLAEVVQLFERAIAEAPDATPAEHQIDDDASDPPDGLPPDGLPPDPPDGGDGGDDEPAIDPETLAYCAEQPPNDTGNGRRLLAWYRGELLNVREMGWHGWTSTHWDREGGDEAATRAAQETAERIAVERHYIEFEEHEARAVQAAEELKGYSDDELSKEQTATRERAKAAHGARGGRRAARRKFAVTCGNTGRIVGMLSQALPHCTIAPDKLDRDPMRFNCRSGTLVFRRVLDPDCPDPEVSRYTLEVERRDHDQSDLISHLAPVDYDPAARAPTWLALLERFQPDPAQRRFLQTYMGLMLTGLVVQHVLFNWGKGANGKSTIIEAIAGMLGGYADVLNPESIMEMDRKRGDQATPDFAKLPGKRLVRIPELKRGETINESMIKRLTGGEEVPVRHLNRGFFMLKPVFKAVMSGNDKPNIQGGDEGIWRRMFILLWPVSIPKAERREMIDVLAELEPERPGMLNWLIEGLSIFIREGLHAPESVQLFTEQHRSEMDPLGEFIGDCIVQKTDGRVQARAAYQAFVSWCQANAVKPWSETAFGRQMASKGFSRISGRSSTNSAVKFYENIELQNVPERPEDKGKSSGASPPDPLDDPRDAMRGPAQGPDDGDDF